MDSYFHTAIFVLALLAIITAIMCLSCIMENHMESVTKPFGCLTSTKIGWNLGTLGTWDISLESMINTRSKDIMQIAINHTKLKHGF